MAIANLFTLQRYLLIIAIITGAIGTLAFSPYNLWPVSILSLSSLLALTINRNCRQSALLGFAWGLGFFGTGINWIYISIMQFGCITNLLNATIILILISYLSIYPMIFATLLAKIWPDTNLWRLAFGAPVLYSITEFLRGRVFTGFPWLEFGYSQIDGPLKGLVPLFGVQTITFMLIMISGITVYALYQHRILPAIVALALLLLPLPLCSIHWYYPQHDRAINVALVQGNINQSIKWETNQIAQILKIYLQCTLSVIGKAQIIIWPESAIPDDEINQNTFLIRLDKKIRKTNTRIITGIIEARPNIDGYNYYNSIIVLGESIPYHYPSKNRYNKHHLVLFGETLPLEGMLRQIIPIFNLPISSISKGCYLQPQLKVANMKITATICYEIIFGDQVRDNFRPDTDLLLTVSNDAWFGDSIGPWQQFQMARMRALELGRPLLHSTNNGITAVINADGTLQSQLPQFTRDVLIVRVTPTHGMSLYAITGYWPLWIFMFLTGIAALFFDRRRKLIKLFK